MRHPRNVNLGSDRLVSTPLTLRNLRMTAYAQLDTNDETELLAAESGAYHDLVEVEFLNTSAVAVSVSLNDTLGGGVVRAFTIPATSSLQRTFSVPIPQSYDACAWTVEFGATDVSNTQVDVYATFIKELTLPE